MKRLLLITVVLSCFSAISAQIDTDTKIPVDPEYRIGKLENGLTYYIRHNSEPAGRASYYIIQNAGAILENDSQNGLAHFLEHMALNGTQHFPGKDILNRMARHGVVFGPDLNAYTSWDETVYNISDVPVDKPGLIDTCLMILADWSDFLTLSDDEINKERGVIIEEWRTRRNASMRMMDKFLPVIFEGSRYAKRNIIGDTMVIKTFHPDTLRSFYHKWYRTDLQAIAVVGDINIDDVEASIKKIFAPIPRVVNAPPRPENLLVPKPGIKYILATDPEAPQTSINMIILDREPDIKPRDMNYIRDGFVIALMNSMMRNRFSELLQKGTPPFISGILNYGPFIARNYNSLTLAATARENEEAKAFEAAFMELERARRHGFTQGELERSKATILANFENSYKQKDKINNDSWVSQVQDHFLTGDPLPSMDLQYDYYKQILPLITKEEVTARLKNLAIDDNNFILVEGPEDKRHITESEVLEIIAKVKAADIDPYMDMTGGPDLIGETLIGAAVVKSVPLQQFGATEWTLANGARVVFRHADFEKDNVSLSGFSYGGSSIYADSLVPALSLFAEIISMYGAGNFDNVTLTKMLAGKKASVSLGMQETIQTITGSATPKDFETMMQLLYLRFARPNFNREAFDAIHGRYTALVTAMQKNPNKIMSDSMSLNLTGYHPRTFIMTPESMNKIRFEDVNYIYRTAFDDAASFTFFITGNIDEAEAKRMAEKYIGSLPSSYLTEMWRDNGIRQPEGIVRKEIPLPLEVPKATVVISYTAKTKYKPANYLAMDVLKGILNLLYTEKVREDQSGTYSVQLNTSSQQRPVEKSLLLIAFECDPERVSELKTIIYFELQNIAENGPTKDYLEKAVSTLLKNREEAIPHNNYWAGAIRTFYLTGIDTNSDRNFSDVLNEINVKDIRKTVKKYLAKADLLEIVFVPGEK